MSRPLWRRPRELGRALAGNTVQYVAKASAIASAVSVAIGNGETLEGKVSDALILPDLLQSYRRTKYVIEHQEEIQQALSYVKERAPTPEQLQQMGESARSAVVKAQVFADHLSAVGNNLALRSFHPVTAYEHLQQAVQMLPTMPDAYKVISESSAKAAEVMHHLQQIDYQPAYSAMLHIADNFSRDEVAMTLGVMAAFSGAIYAAGSYIGGTWISRGIPDWFSRWKTNFGVRRNKAFYVKNLDVILGDDLYAAAEEHFQSRKESNTGNT